MKTPNRILVWLLRVSGARTLTVLGAVFMPYDWMNVTRPRPGMVDLPHRQNSEAIINYVHEARR